LSKEIEEISAKYNIVENEKNIQGKIIEKLKSKIQFYE
jgi:hypothetical protein